MPYQRSTQASGFKKRTGPDESKQLRQYATALDKQRKENVTGMERQGVQMTNEMTRIDALASKKDTYELQNLRNFSKTLDTFLNTVATNVVKPVFDQQIENGVTEGIKYQQGDPDVVAKIDASDAQLKELEDRIALQAANTTQTVEAIREQWEKEGKIASLQEEYRLLNIKKLGSNRAFGFRKGMLMQSATGWDAYRDSSLLYDEENERSTENIGSEEDPIIVGHYHRYTGEDGFEKRKAILGHLTNKYVVEKGKESNLSETFINKLLTRPILQSNADFQQKESKKALLEEAAASSEYNKYQVSQGIEGIDSSHEQLELGIQNWILTEPGNLKALNTAGGNTVNAIDGLVEAMIGEASEIRTDAMKNEDDQLDFIDAIQNKVKVYVPGLSKRIKNKETGEWEYEKKFLHELWPNKFNIDNIEALLAEETGKFQREKYATLTSLINGDKNRILKDFALTRDTQAFDTAIGVMENNPEYLGHPGIDGLKKKMNEAKEKINYPRDLSDKKLNDLFEENNGKAIRDTHPLLQKLDEGTIKQGILDGKIDAELFHKEDVAKAAHLKNVETLKEELLKGLDLHASEIEWDEDDSQVVKAINLLDSTLYNYTKDYLSKDKGASVGQAVEAARIQLTKEVMSHIDPNIPNVDGKTTWEIDANGFTNKALNEVVAAMGQPYRNVKMEVIKDDATIKNVKSLMKNSSHVDIFSDKSQPPVVKVGDFQLNSAGEVPQLWNQLSRIDPLRRTPEMLYDLQAGKFPEIQKGNWSPEIQQQMADWEALYPEIRRALVDGDFSAAKRAMQSIGKLDIDSTISTLLTPNGDFALEEGEFSTLLNSLGLSQMTLEEAQANPEILLAAYKKKIITVTEQVQAVTTDQNQALRMIFAGVKFGDINKWNEGKYADYTMAALNSYYSGDRTALDKLERKFNTEEYESGSQIDLQSGENIQLYDDPGNDLNAIEEQIAFLDTNEPPKLIKTGTVPASLGLLAETQFNPAYTAWAKQKQLLNDRKNLMSLSQEKVINPNQESTFFASGKRLIGNTRYTELQNLVIEKFPGLEIHPKYGTLYNPSAKGKYTKTFDNGKEMMKVLMLNELGFEGQSMGGLEGDTTGDLALDKSLYTKGSSAAGKLPESDLVKIKGYVFGNSSANEQAEDIKIRKDVAPDLNNMIDDAAKVGIYLNFTEDDSRFVKTGEGLKTRIKWKKGSGSGYRTKEGSERLLAEKGSDIAAKPGYSTHNLGTGVDFQFSADDVEAEKQREWLHREGWKYGFVPFPNEKGEPDYSLTLDDNEVWHFDWRPEYKKRTN